MLNAAVGLRDFALQDSGMCGCPDQSESGHCLQSLDTSNPLLLAVGTHALRSIHLSEVKVHPSILLTSLHSWLPTLEDLNLSCVYIPAGGNAWLEVFRKLYSCQKLEEFQAVGLEDDTRISRRPDGTTTRGYVLLRDDEDSRGDSLCLGGREQVQQVLLLRGCTRRFSTTKMIESGRTIHREHHSR